jgi:hypothetical protein
MISIDQDVTVVAEVLFVVMELHEDEEDVTLLLGAVVSYCIGVIVSCCISVAVV